MDESSVRVGMVVSGSPTSLQATAAEWASSRYEVEQVSLSSLSRDSTADYDVLWWHRGESQEHDTATLGESAAAGLEAYVRNGGGLLLGLCGMEAVTALGIEPVEPDEVGVETVTEPTGLLWKSIHADHPAVESFDGYRIPVADRGTAPYARYRNILPQRGEILASTVEGDRPRPEKMSVVAWYPGDGQVLGVGTPVTFDTDYEAAIERNRDAFVGGAIEALADEPNPQYARPKTGGDLERLRERLRDDVQRPQCRITPPANWLNDPNGLIKWNGRYHVFYQYNPAGPFHETIHWGHAVSDDLVTWHDEPVALTPSPDGPDRDGCWSGCTVVDDGTPTVIYTGGRDREQLPCLATSDDPNLTTWRKRADNPIIEELPDGLDIRETDHWQAEFRDHCVWQDDDRWYHLIGSGLDDVGGAALLYTGTDLTDWTYEGPVLVGDWDGAGAVWECPELLRFGDRDLLHVSNYEDVLYFVGQFEDGDFDVSTQGVIDHGDFYAPQSMQNGDRYLTWGWLPEARDLEAQWAAGWSGAMSLPRVLEMNDHGLVQRPAPELTELRGRRDVADESIALSEGDRRALDTDGRTLELELTISLDDADAVTLSVFEAPDREEVTDIRYGRDSTLRVDRARSSLDPRATNDPQSMDVTPVDEPLTLRLFLDGSVVEAFANERHCLTSRVYPTREDSTGVSLVAEGGRASVTDLSVWQLGSAWPDTAGDGDASVASHEASPSDP